MATGIRLLSRRPVERKTAQYDVLLARILLSRFITLLRLVFILSWFLSLIIARRVFPVVTILHIFSATAIILFLQKCTVVARTTTKACLFDEWRAKFSSPRLFLVIGFYLASSLVYKHLISDSAPRLVTLQFGPREIPPGLPKELVQHDITVFNAQWLYPTGYMLYLTLVVAGMYVGFDRNVIAFVPEELGVGPLPRLHRRFGGIVTRALFVWSVTSVSWPFLYFAIMLTGSSSNLDFLTLLRTPVKWFLLPFIWELAHGTFQAYISLGPIHCGRTISENSQDPNGSLSQGLKARSGSLTELMAWNELLLIAEQIPRRRQSLFDDADSDRIVWKLVYGAYQSLFSVAIDELDKATRPKKKKQEKAPTVEDPHVSDAIAPERKLPELHTITGKNVYSFDKPSIGVRLVARLQDDMHTKGAEAHKKLAKAESMLSRWSNRHLKQFLGSACGVPFRRTAARELSLRLPNANVLEVAMRSIAALMVDSIKDDTVGYVQTTVAQNLELLDKFLILLEKQAARPPAHWTVEGEEADISLLEDLGEEAQNAFVLVTDAFEPWLDNLKVSRGVRERKERVSTVSEDLSTS